MKNSDKEIPMARRIQRVVGLRNRLAKIALWIVGVTPLLAKRPPHAYPYSALEMWRLYRDIRRRQPETVMEFGVGCSTITIAAALEKNGKGKLFTVDGSQEWINVCRDSLPESLRKYVEFNYSPVEQIEGEHAHRYTSRPKVTLDYLFVDGPSVQQNPNWEGPPIAADPVLDMKFNDGARITVEGRPKNVRFLEEHLDSSWRMKRYRTLSWVSFDHQA